MNDLRSSIILNLSGNLEARAKRFSRSVGEFARSSERQFSRVSRAAGALGKGLDRVANRWTGLATGAGAVGTLRMLGNLEERMTRLGIQANITDEAVGRFKEQVYQTAQAPDIRLDPDQIISAVEAIVEKTGDLEFAEANLRNIGIAIQATGAQGGSIGEILAEFQKQGVTSLQEVMAAMDTLNQQGKKGAFTLKDLAALGPRVVTSYTAWGRVGPQAMREMGAALQVIRQGAGSSEESATRFEALLRSFQNPETLKVLRKGGITVFDPAKLKEGQRVLRPINELIAEIVRTTKGDPIKLKAAFPDSTALQAFNAVIGEYSRTGELTSLDKFMQVQADGTATLNDSARAARDANAALTSLFTAWKKFADNKLTGPIQATADALNAIGSENTGHVMEGLAVGAAALGGLVLGRKAWRAGKGAWSFLRGGKGGALAGAAGALGGGGPIPVYVVNDFMSMMPGEMGGGFMGGLGKAGKTAGKVSRFGRVMGRFGKYAGRAGGIVSALGAGIGLISTLTDDSMSTTQKINAASGQAGGALGGWGGAALGAALGTAILPGIGTALGGLIGGLSGYAGGEWGGGKLAQFFTGGNGGQAVAEAPKGRLEIAVQDERVQVRRAQASGMDLDVDNGMILGGVGG